jgi:hypothetical protein
MEIKDELYSLRVESIQNRDKLIKSGPDYCHSNPSFRLPPPSDPFVSKLTLKSLSPILDNP